MKKRSKSTIFVTLLCTAAYVISVPVHSLDLEKAVAQADLIITGRVLSVDEEGDTSLDIPGAAAVPATRFRSTLRVDRVLKGDLRSPDLIFEFLIPEYPMGLKGASSGQYSIFFLKRGQRRWAFVDPTNPDLPAVPGDEPMLGTALDRVTAAVAQVLGSPDSTNRDYFRALDALGRLRTDFARDLLRQALGRSSGGLRLDIARTLVSRGDILALPVVENALKSGGLSESMIATLPCGRGISRRGKRTASIDAHRPTAGDA